MTRFCNLTKCYPSSFIYWPQNPRLSRMSYIFRMLYSKMFVMISDDSQLIVSSLVSTVTRYTKIRFAFAEYWKYNVFPRQISTSAIQKNYQQITVNLHITVTLMLTVPTQRDRFTVLVIRDIQEMESPVLVSLSNQFINLWKY